jgi:hypothetical protein
METKTRSILNALWNIGWTGYATTTAYFVDRSVDAKGRSQYTLVFTTKKAAESGASAQ